MCTLSLHSPASAADCLSLQVAYEVFCSLSLHYESHRDKVLEYLLKNWDAVKKTRAWTQSLELLDEGNLPGGAAVLRKILEKATIKP
ncbi:hypothetical protein JCM6882_003396 [Rhodosporidiobolus microsporus]